MRKFRIKARGRLVILAFILVVIITVAGNISLMVNKKTVDYAAAHFFSHSITIGSIFYLFPDRIILNDIVVKKLEPSSGDSSFGISKVSTRKFLCSEEAKSRHLELSP